MVARADEGAWRDYMAMEGADDDDAIRRIMAALHSQPQPLALTFTEPAGWMETLVGRPVRVTVLDYSGPAHDLLDPGLAKYDGATQHLVLHLHAACHVSAYYMRRFILAREVGTEASAVDRALQAVRTRLDELGITAEVDRRRDAAFALISAKARVSRLTSALGANAPNEFERGAAIVHARNTCADLARDRADRAVTKRIG